MEGTTGRRSHTHTHTHTEPYLCKGLCSGSDVREGERVEGPLPKAANPGVLVGMEPSIVSVGNSPERAVRGEGLVGDRSPRPDGCGNPGPSAGSNCTPVSNTHTHTE